MTEITRPAPLVDVSTVDEIARDVLVVPNRGVGLVPNIGVVGGTHSVLVVDTGMGPANAVKVLQLALEHARGRRLYLTTTHFHPEHAFGAQVFADEATYLVNQTQADELAAKGEGYLEMFRGLGEAVAEQLRDVRLVAPDAVHDGSHDLDLGGRVVRLRATGRGHTLGDQVVTVPDAGVMFTGDLVEAGQFAIFPWFPPHDTDVSGTRWISVMRRLAHAAPQVVVPGHGAVSGPELLDEVLTYLELLRDETWRRRDSAMDLGTIEEEVRAVVVAEHPDWVGQEWIEPGINCLCAEVAVSALPGSEPTDGQQDDLL